MIVARRYVITGRVQGVGFRWFTHDAAAREGLHGWVRNLANGSVEVVAEGESAAVQQLEAAVRRGPPQARVEHVAVEDHAPAGRLTGFEIR
jgi:acylphosphatase